jgi:hypothetical protein
MQNFTKYHVRQKQAGNQWRFCVEAGAVGVAPLQIRVFPNLIFSQKLKSRNIKSDFSCVIGDELSSAIGLVFKPPNSIYYL